MDNLSFAELVFGFVYAVGTDVEPVIRVLRNYLKQYGYRSEEFRVSKKLRTLDLGIKFEGSSEFDRMKALMDGGNEACKRAKDDRMLAVMAINDIASRRTEDEQKRPVQMARTANLIRSLKRPEEVQLLRQVYRPGFFLIGIADDDDSQRAYLTKEIGLTDEQAERLIKRDQDEHVPFGQRTRKTFYLADVFVQRRGEAYKKQLERFLDLIFGHPFKTPTREEHAMFMAYASAARSAQLGRQVGAAIATPDGDVIAVGMNDVPSQNGGPYWEGDTEDHRDHNKIDSNVVYRTRIVKSVVEKLNGKLLTAEHVTPIIKNVIDDLTKRQTPEEVERITAAQIEKNKDAFVSINVVEDWIETSDLRDITEYGRAVHGEMDAILTCARLGISVQGKYLFVTTFPCHNCTRHIISAGIKKVYYIEPYPKSKARDLHSDAICFDEREAKKSGKIPFLPFVGIGPRRYLDLFSLELSSGRIIERKDDEGIPSVMAKSLRPPRVPMLPLSYLEREDKLLDEFGAILRELQRSQSWLNRS
jgi:deoxycytidylate deaminase